MACPQSVAQARVMATIFEKDMTDFEVVKVELLEREHKKLAYLALQPLGECESEFDRPLTLFGVIVERKRGTREAMYGGDDSGGHYTNRLPKHPRLSRMQGIEQVNGDPHRGGKQPRPLEDGNWICDDTSCANVNYPRRTECNKCGKRRGPLGDQVVKAYIESIKIARGEMAPSPQLVSVGPEQLGMARGMMPPHNGSDVSPQQQGISISPGSSNLVGELEPWMGGGYEQPIPSFASQYVTGDGGLSGRRSTLSAATEGKRLAEQLVASFAASSDPVGDAGECLASAALWLQTMKARMQTGDSFGLSTSSLSSPMPGTSSPMVLGGPLLGMNGGVPMLTQSPLSTASIGSNAGLGNLAINSGTSVSNGSMMGNHLARVNPPSVGISPGARALLPRTLRYEDYKERPSDYLREFGDPAAVSATATGGGHRPESGVFGNWECEECKNVNFPRRTNCFQCHKRRGTKGEEIVRKYVRSLIEEANRA